ncbi:uncharacterized protein LOC112567280 isoform X2 [Pomacea canaliculata]|uniref:uncharacterized protein LOC112567280 isoform X2 n=1 Tax=Pomacea canaliculata TaxID=400727 RepID=UPI000D72CC90|nr:uncharacterized protein LOC112567280 isoform X2 [Pomacea canaliculata]
MATCGRVSAMLCAAIRYACPPDQCTSIPNAYCDQFACACKTLFYGTDGETVCHSRKLIGSDCVINDECVEHAQCEDGTCKLISSQKCKASRVSVSHVSSAIIMAAVLSTSLSP